MEEQNTVENEGLSFSDIWAVIKKYWIGLVTIIFVCAIIGILSAFFIVPKKYEVTQRIYYLEEKSPDAVVPDPAPETFENKDNANIDQNASERAVDLVFPFLNDRPVYENTTKILNEKIPQYQVDPLDYKDLMKNLTLYRNDRLIITITYSSSDKEIMPEIINTFTDQAISFIDNKFGFEFSSDKEIEQKDIYNVSTSIYLVIGASVIVGLVIGLCYEFIANSRDKTIKSKNFVEDAYNIKVIGLIPDFQKASEFDTKK